MTHTAISVASKILELAKIKKDTVTPMQLLKLVYLCHGWMLGIHGRHLISDEIEAWKYGPVIPSLYQAVRHYRSQPVDSLNCDQRLEKSDFDETEENVIQQVYEKYGKKSGVALSSLTHIEGSPWDITVNKLDGMGKPISNNLIEEYYARHYQDSVNNQPDKKVA